MNSSAIKSPTTRIRRLENPSTSAWRRSRRSASPGNGCTLRAINMRQNPARSRRKVVHRRVGAQIVNRLARLLVADTGSHQNAARADRAREADVEPAVTHDERSSEIEREIVGRAVDEAASRLAA